MVGANFSFHQLIMCFREYLSIFYFILYLFTCISEDVLPIHGYNTVSRIDLVGLFQTQLHFTVINNFSL